MSISKKLSLGLLGITALVVVLSYSSLRSVSGLGAALDTAVNSDARKIDLAGSLTSGFHDMRVQARGVEISLILMQLDSKGDCTMCHTADFVQTQEEQFAAAAGGVKKSIAGLRPMATDEAEKKTWGRSKTGSTAGCLSTPTTVAWQNATSSSKQTRS
jgi:hypothetical protein